MIIPIMMVIETLMMTLTDDDSDDIDQIVGVSANTVIPKALHRQGR